MNNRDQLLKKLEAATKLIADQKYALDKAAIVAITDEKGNIRYVNDKFCLISGYSEEELLGKTHRIVNSGTHPKGFFVDMWKTISSGDVWQGEICNRSKKGSIYWVDTTIVPFLDKEGVPYQYIAIRSDITHRKETEESLEEERERLFMSEKMASLGILSSGISHELGNPLGALRGRLEMLEMAATKESFTAEKVNEAVERMIPLVDRMAKIIRGLRSYSRDGSQDPYESVDLGNLISDIVEISRDNCRKHEVEVKLFGINNGIKVFAREAELAQVIVNLLNNSIDAVKGEKNRLIEMNLSVQDSFARLLVCDSGPGIPDEILPKIFDPFYTTKSVGEGTGLGLSISRSIIENHKGTICYLRKDGMVCFEILIPQPQ